MDEWVCCHYLQTITGKDVDILSGPGASSMLGALFEIGPCSVTEDGEQTIRNPHSWTEFANVVFVE